MSRKSFTAALTLYRSETLTLKQAAQYSGVSTAALESALRSRGIAVREDPQNSARKQTAR